MRKDHGELVGDRCPNVDKVSLAEFQPYSKALASSLSKGHEVIKQNILVFMERQMRMPSWSSEARSSFPPFDVKKKHLLVDDLERVCIDISIRRDSNFFHITYKSSTGVVPHEKPNDSRFHLTGSYMPAGTLEEPRTASNSCADSKDKDARFRL